MSTRQGRKSMRFLMLLGLVVSGLGQHDLSATTVAYSGKLTGDNSTHNAPGYFRFSIVDPAGTVLWTHSNKPSATISLPVENGHYIILLGGSKTKAFPERLWLDHRLVFLKVSFSSALGKPLDQIHTNQPILSLYSSSSSRAGNLQVAHPRGALNPENGSARLRAALNKTLYFTPNQSAAAWNLLQTYSSLTKKEKEELEKITWEEAVKGHAWAIELLGGIAAIQEHSRKGSPIAKQILMRLSNDPSPTPGQADRQQIAIRRAHVFSGRESAYDEYGPLAGGLRKNANHSFNVITIKDGKIVSERNGDPITRKITFAQFDRLRRDAFLYEKPMNIRPATAYGKKIAMITKGSPSRRLRRNREEYWENGKRWRWIGDRTGFATEIEPPPE